jgi:hypothetical protein
MGWTIGVLGFNSRRGQGNFLFTTASRTALGPTQPLNQWVKGALSLGVKWPGHEADHSPPSSAEIKNAWRYTSTLQYVSMAWGLVKHRDNFTFTLTTSFKEVELRSVRFAGKKKQDISCNFDAECSWKGVAWKTKTEMAEQRNRNLRWIKLS